MWLTSKDRQSSILQNILIKQPQSIHIYLKNSVNYMHSGVWHESILVGLIIIIFKSKLFTYKLQQAYYNRPFKRNNC